MSSSNYNKTIKRLLSSKPMLAVLVDPDKYNPQLITLASQLSVHCVLVGGSRLEKGDVRVTVKDIKRRSGLPVILFPGDESQLCREADGLLLLSLLSGRNVEYLIDKHVKAAPLIKKLKLAHMPVAYLLIGGSGSTTQKVTLTDPMNPKNKKLVVNTCLAAEQLGFKAVYLEAGSGSSHSVSPALVRLVRKNISLPIIVGGGIDSAKKTNALIKSGANMLVVGNALEKNVYLISEISQCFKP